MDNEEINKAIQTALQSLISLQGQSLSPDRRAAIAGNDIAAILLAILDYVPLDIRPHVEQALFQHLLLFFGAMQSNREHEMADPGRGIDETRAKIWTDIQKHGFSIMGVVGDEDTPHCTYTIGLAPSMPELIIFGLRPDHVTPLFHIVVEMSKNKGIRFDSGKTYEDINERFPLYFHQVNRSRYEQYVGVAIRYHNTRNFPLLQVVWPDTQGVFPWQAGFEERFRKDQPLLFKPQ